MEATSPNTTFERERMEEFFAVINMIGYAKGIAKDLGVPDAASDLEAASLKLAEELQSEIYGEYSTDDITKFANAISGTC
ncbi:hypothetical protein [Cohaesibacter gelatinilyticus]|uniref:Uncharacterized protein n=1 Tax=Cohaesibacter gelatinilyticus TaxID=372072 RepID=A0A285PD24_9HYPH|nr:hypothetical protein [Cohaesibacter gelatinilyticus]SNZ19113.1 hypothetical protein SAMN06265368_2193 [Cohaesibacter gelatinilyticus]HAT85100.1 hypothetical protein [Hyphomicrobiales bacterium]